MKKDKEYKEAVDEYSKLADMFAKEMLDACKPILMSTPNPAVAMAALGRMVNIMVPSICIAGGMPVVDTMNSVLQQIAYIPKETLAKYEKAAEETLKRRIEKAKATASIVDMNGNPLK